MCRALMARKEENENENRKRDRVHDCKSCELTARSIMLSEGTSLNRRGGEWKKTRRWRCLYGARR